MESLEQFTSGIIVQTSFHATRYRDRAFSIFAEHIRLSSAILTSSPETSGLSVFDLHQTSSALRQSIHEGIECSWTPLGAFDFYLNTFQSARLPRWSILNLCRMYPTLAIFDL